MCLCLKVLRHLLFFILEIESFLPHFFPHEQQNRQTLYSESPFSFMHVVNFGTNFVS